MQRYFLQNNQLIDGTVQLIGEDYHHLVRVMRGEVGDHVKIVFLDGKVAVCEITSIEKDLVNAKVLSYQEENRELPVEVTIASGLLKGDKFDIVVQKGTELGAHAFLPFVSQRSIVKLDEKKKKKRVERWQKIAKEAAEQCERNLIPEVFPPCSFQELLRQSQNYTSKIVAYEEKGRKESKELPKIFETIESNDSLLFVFGSEGGFTEEEIQILKEHDFVVCGLGPRILRAETAPLYALSVISFYYELMR